MYRIDFMTNLIFKIVLKVTLLLSGEILKLRKKKHTGTK